MANLNPNEIWAFLDRYPSTSARAVYADGHAHPHSLPYDSEPIADVSEASWSECTTATAQSQSVFSGRHRRNGRRAPSSVGQTSAPSRGPLHAGLGRHGADDHGLASPNSAYVLWCEFSKLKNCNATFAGDDIAGWIEHHTAHLRNKFPRRVVCWFCDHIPFVAESKADRRANFEERMEHIREHINSDYMEVDNMRPDFFVVESLYKNGQIDQGTYQYAIAYTELPLSLRLPADDAMSRPAASSAVQYQCHDLEKEERHRRRQRKDARKCK